MWVDCFSQLSRSAKLPGLFLEPDNNMEHVGKARVNGARAHEARAILRPEPRGPFRGDRGRRSVGASVEIF